jgi:hypothetical protein
MPHVHMAPRWPLLLLLSACSANYSDVGYLLWDPDRAAAANDGLYVHLPYAGAVVRLQPDAEPTQVDLGGDQAIDVTALPDGEGVLVRTSRVRCEDEEVEPGDPIWRCASEDRISEVEASLVVDGAVTRSWDIRPELAPFQISPDSSFALAMVDPDAPRSGGGLVNLTAMRVLDLRSGDDWEVAIGFNASRIELLQDPDGLVTGALVLSEGEVAVVDLLTPSPEPSVVFPLSLDPDVRVVPSDVLVTPDGGYALITTAGSPDLYVLDLLNPAINIIALRGAPAAMALDAAGDRTFLVYPGQPWIDAIDHARFEITSWQTETGFDHVEVRDGFVLACTEPDGEEVWRLDPATDELTEYQLNYSVGQLHVAPDSSFAMTTPRSGAAFELLDLQPDAEGRLDDRARPYGLDAAVADAAFTEDADGTSVLILQQGQPDVYQLRWPALTAEPIELGAPPRAIGAMPGGGFFITHEEALGRVSFLSADGALAEVAGFLTYDLLREPTLAGEEE